MQPDRDEGSAPLLRSSPEVSSAPAAPGRRAVKVEPLPGSLVTVTSPSIMRASHRVIASPRPVPPKRRAVEASAW